MFLKYIKEEKLLRFSSVKEAFALFTGIYYDPTKDYEHRANYVMDCILENKTKEYLEDENPLKVYIALYTLAIEDKQKAWDYIVENYKEAKSYRRACFVYFLKESNSKIDSKFIVHCLNNEEDNTIKALLISNMPSIMFENDEYKKEYIKTFLNSIKNIKSTAKYILFEDTPKSNFYVDDKYNQILQYIYELNDDELYKEAYKLFGKYSIQAAITNEHGYYEQYTYLNKIHHPAQKEALIRGLSSLISDVRKDCYEILEKLKIEFTDEEYLELAKQLKSKRSDLRNNICALFKKASPMIIIDIATYLVKQKKDELKSGGLNILVDNLNRIKTLAEFQVLKEEIKEIEFAHEVEVLKNTLLEENNLQDKSLKESKIIELDVPTLTWNQKLVDKVFKYDFSLMKTLIYKWYDIFIAHKDEEIEVVDYNGSKTMQIVGTDILTIEKAYYTFDENKNKKYYTRYCFYEEYLSELDNIDDEDFALLNYMKELIENYLEALDNKTSQYAWQEEKQELGKYDFYIKNNILPDLKGICTFITEGKDTTTISKSFKNILNFLSEKKEKEKDIDYKKLAKIKFENFKNVLELLCSYQKEEKNILYTKLDKYNEIMLNHLAYSVEFYKNSLKNLPECFDDIDNTNLKVPFFKSDFVLSGMKYFDDNFAFNILKNQFSFYDKHYSPVHSLAYFYFLDKGLLSREYLVNKLLDIKFETKSRYSTDHVIEEISRMLRYKSNYYKQE